jgi:aspartate aminotransferase-like enzyme
MVAPRVYQAMAQLVVGHLDPFFFQVVEEVRSLLGYAFSTKNQFNVALSGTGSAGMEAAEANFIEPGLCHAIVRQFPPIRATRRRKPVPDKAPHPESRPA